MELNQDIKLNLLQEWKGNLSNNTLVSFNWARTENKDKGRQNTNLGEHRKT